MKVSEKVRNRRQSAACLPRGPLRTQQPAHVGDETLSEEIEFEIRRSYLIRSLRLLEKAKSARAAVEKRGVHAVWQFHQMISIYRKDIVALREKKRRTEALLPYAKQLKVLRDGLTRVVMLEDDIQSSIKYLVETTRRKLSVLPFAPSTMPHQEAEKVLQQAEAALQSPELEKLPLLIQALESYQHLKEKMDRVLLNSEKCAHLIKEIEDMAIDDEKYRKFVDMMPILQRNGQPSGTSG